MSNFRDLPYELRLGILDWFIQDVRNHGSASKEQLAICAVVCKEWQDIVERETFRQLILSPLRVHTMCLNIRHRKNLVKHIIYNVDLKRGIEIDLFTQEVRR
jgi:hypothetical protein